MFPEPWVREIVEDEWGGAASLKVGRYYTHPDDGLIKIIGGQFWGEHGLSNHWTWTVLRTNEQSSGYGGDWPNVEVPWKDELEFVLDRTPDDPIVWYFFDDEGHTHTTHTAHEFHTFAQEHREWGYTNVATEVPAPKDEGFEE